MYMPYLFLCRNIIVVLPFLNKIVRNNPESVNHELYGNWIKCYSGEEYCGLNKVFVEALENAVKDYSEEKLNHIAEIFRECSLYEMEFWNMGNKD